MNKKNLFVKMSMAALLGLSIASCNNASSKMDEQPAETAKEVKGMKIAFVEVDSLKIGRASCRERV